NEWLGRIAEAIVQSADANGDGKLSRDELLAYYQREHGYLSVESRRMLLEPAAAKAALQAATEMKLWGVEAGVKAAPTLVSLAILIEARGEKVPYSIVAAVDPELPPPLGPFLPPGVSNLQDDEIILADWPDSPLKVKPGDEIRLTYFEPVEG